MEGFSRIRVKKVPLGVIFHIAAGNMDFLPAYSLAEGLLAGNINILKLPSADNGLSLKLIMQLIEYQPELKDFIYVFDTSSTDIQGMRTMAELSNGISVWGSDMAIEAVRGLAPTGAKLIEWGQKLGFCYISDPEHAENIEQDLEGLAKHIAFTKQLLCSSCQVIYLDTKDMQEVRKFAERFFPILQKAVDAHASDEIGIRARDTLVAYTQRLKRYLGEEEKNGRYDPRQRDEPDPIFRQQSRIIAHDVQRTGETSSERKDHGGAFRFEILSSDGRTHLPDGKKRRTGRDLRKMRPDTHHIRIRYEHVFPWRVPRRRICARQVYEGHQYRSPLLSRSG